MRIRVLVVDDEALIALDIAQQLNDAGYETIGPATSVATALKLLREQGCDAAVLDVQLGSETSEQVAHELRALRKPFVILSGYSNESLKSKFGDAPLLCKPPRVGAVIAALNQGLERSNVGAVD